MFICAYKINKQPPLSVVWCGLRFGSPGRAWHNHHHGHHQSSASVVQGLGLLGLPPLPPWCGAVRVCLLGRRWCGVVRRMRLLGGGWIGVVIIIINNIIISIIIPFLVGSSVTGTGACQERDPRDSCMFNSLMSESWLESVHCHKNRVCLGRVDGFGAATWKKCAHSQRFGRVGRG